MNKIEQIFKTATAPAPAWTNHDIACFHAHNPHGLVARKRANDDRIASLVDAGKAKSGAHLAYGTFDTFCVDRVQELCDMRRVPTVALRVALRMLEDQIRTTDAFIAERN